MGRNYVRPFDICNVIYANCVSVVSSPAFPRRNEKSVCFVYKRAFLSIEIACVVLIIFKVS